MTVTAEKGNPFFFLCCLSTGPTEQTDYRTNYYATEMIISNLFGIIKAIVNESTLSKHCYGTQRIKLLLLLNVKTKRKCNWTSKQDHKGNSNMCFSTCSFDLKKTIGKCSYNKKDQYLFLIIMSKYSQLRRKQKGFPNVTNSTHLCCQSFSTVLQPLTTSTVVGLMRLLS